ncbi:type 1 periplasmic binding fold superfamily protein [Aquimarina brevivitae]|uniref:Type 1 periplasmic binding fold superfamily protein n=1 Tax=Aquimarina brevivitae TaxID=323412 RepID=A0A4Q7PGM2_9FLAO|nr:type 1 periplasmic binding fold superfamily protein [Aquimarina brevivitae]RZS99525.1 hypothetical protein EV197_0746 [Aquimarina brevivitae]
MKNVTLKYLTILFLSITVLSCSDDDDPAVINEEETITTVKLTVTESGSTTSTEYTWTEDSQDPITLQANTTYNFTIEFLDESNPDDVEDITAEVIAEADEHYVFYENTVTGLVFQSAADDTQDSNDISINVSTDWTTGSAGTGIIRAYLIHEPTTKTGDSRADFGGETDIEVEFTTTVQ